MKSFLAIPLFAAAALATAEPNWDFTFTFSEGQSTWTSCTSASVNPTVSPVPVVSSAWSGPAEFTSTTSYTAVFSSGSSTWGIPTTVSYAVSEGWTSMLPAPTSSVLSSSAKVEASTTVKPVSSVAATTSPAPSTFTGAANINGKMAGVGAVAMAGLALVL